VVGDRGGRVVKLIGDEVMFITPDADAACDIALALVETFDAQGVTPRGGLSHGEIVARGGDYYGRYVNLAARAVDIADPGTVLCGPGVVDAATEHRFEAAELRMLKGFTLPVRLSRLRRT
jgi:adenylate cyclase